MTTKLTKIIKIAEEAGSDEIEIWTNSFKAMGTLFKEEERVEKGIISIKNPIITPLFKENENEDSPYDWLNIFEDQVIAFTIVK